MPVIESKYYCSICHKEYDNYYDAVKCEKVCMNKSVSTCKYEIENRININPPTDYFWTREDSFDDRMPDWLKQRELYGFDNRELWNLNQTIASFIYPRLVRFKEISQCKQCDMPDKEWIDALDSIISAFQLVLQEKTFKEEDLLIIKKGLKNFKKYFLYLWY